MDPGAILSVLSLVLVGGAYVLGPLRTRRAAKVSTAPSTLQAERDRIMDAIQDLDADHALGKVEERDYEAQRAMLKMQGAQVLRQIDEPGRDLEREQLEIELEKAVAAERGRALAQDTQATCPECDSTVRTHDRFCADCGARLSPA